MNNVDKEQKRLIFEEKKFLALVERLTKNLASTKTRLPVIEEAFNEQIEKQETSYSGWHASFVKSWTQEKKDVEKNAKETAKRFKEMITKFEEKLVIQADATVVLAVCIKLDKEIGKKQSELNDVEGKIRKLIPIIRDNERLLKKVVELRKLYEFQMNNFEMSDQRFKMTLNSLNKKKKIYVTK